MIRVKDKVTLLALMGIVLGILVTHVLANGDLSPGLELGMSFIIGVVVIIAFGKAVKKILQPLEDIVAVSKALSLGNYEVELDMRGHDEFGEFGKGFNSAIEALHDVITERKMEIGATAREKEQLKDELQRLIIAAEAIAGKAGNLTQKFEVHKRDEVGRLAEAFNKLIDSLRGIITQIRDASTQISGSVTRIRSTTEEQVAGAAEQSSAVSEVSSTVEELATTASSIAENAESVAETAERTLQGMQEINIKVDRTAKKLLSLGEKSQSIGNITKLIDDIAEQTNLLALNAAIEAARAGEAGRGFAVVASEVRKLEERSSESTEEIRQLINAIQAETNSTIMGIEDSTKWVAKGLEMVKETTKAAKEISTATQQQKSASEQVVQAMQNIDVVTKEFVASTKHAATSATQLNKLSQELKASISEFVLGDEDYAAGGGRAETKD